MGQARLDLIGQKFGSLTVEHFDCVDLKGNTQWICRCDCGANYTARGARLKSGHTTACRDCSFKRMRNPDGIGDMSIHYWNQVIRGAERRGLIVEVSKEDAYGVFLDQNRKCALSGVPIWFPPRTNRPQEGNASLDRIDSSRGYILDNIQWVHKVVNRMKMDLTESEFLEWCGRLVDNVVRSSTETRID